VLDALLTRTQRRIVKCILSRGGEVVLREDVERARAYGHDTECKGRRSSLDTHMREIRKRVEPFGVRILTIRGEGFRAKLSAV
jgi:DNA-binding response OmpR family regulator